MAKTYAIHYGDHANGHIRPTSHVLDRTFRSGDTAEIFARRLAAKYDWVVIADTDGNKRDMSRKV